MILKLMIFKILPACVKAKATAGKNNNDNLTRKINNKILHEYSTRFIIKCEEINITNII